MIEQLKLFDSYNRQARLYPALLTFLPLALVVAAWFPKLLLASAGGVVLTIAASCGLLFLLADVARSRGKRLEPKLIDQWGGWPTTTWLRHGCNRLAAPTKARYHTFLSERAALPDWPTAATEAARPADADEVYASAVGWLREQCRGEGFDLIRLENATYGFRRNLLGMKPIGLVLCAVALLASLAAIALAHPPKGGTSIASVQAIEPSVLGASLLALVGLMCWTFLVRSSWVLGAGDQYAAALLAACDKLGPVADKPAVIATTRPA